MSQQSKQPSPDSRRGRRKHMSPARPETPKRKAGVAETAGQVTADCAAVCCCCSFGLINLFYLCFIKLPTGLLLRSARKIKRRAHRCRKGPETGSCSCSSSKMKRSSLLYSFEEEIDERFEMGDQAQSATVFVFDLEPSKEAIEFKKEMWNNIVNSGFGRSLSQRYE
ncbi:hypothetical protein LUZ62_072523 [Rhynchospora pubera]|uniref:Uncharacterized protein n=1 Tax=Rhynchospora pubera TaxID=906938 RepID=A0AAV8D0M8_9POAL|nr:hypothetical protein LUZ62_072523 [Rhynchospora pubera]